MICNICMSHKLRNSFNWKSLKYVLQPCRNGRVVEWSNHEKINKKPFSLNIVILMYSCIQLIVMRHTIFENLKRSNIYIIHSIFASTERTLSNGITSGRSNQLITLIKEGSWPLPLHPLPLVTTTSATPAKTTLITRSCQANDAWTGKTEQQCRLQHGFL